MGWKYLAQDVLTGEWRDTDLPLVRDSESPRWELSGAGSLSGTISGDHPWLHANDADAVLREWSTVLYAELDGELAWAGLVQSSGYVGDDWRVEAFGFVSYPNGIPYLGGYQKLVDKDPGVVWAALWQHVQSQPDGNLGLRSIMPPQLGPNIGTKDEPYELSWWEAKDVGSELQQLASEAPFDYVERHEWTVPAAGGERPAFKIGYGNLYGGYDGDDKGWMKKRADDQARYIGTLGYDVFVAVELHEETSKAMPNGAHRWFEGRMRALVGAEWALSEGDGGNQLLYRSNVIDVLGVQVRAGLDDPAQGGSAKMRSESLWTIRHRASGVVRRVSGGHFHADSGKTSRHESRLAEARNHADFVGPDSDVLSFGDWNSYTLGDPTSVYGIMTARTGQVPLHVRTTPANATINSYNGKTQGRWIEAPMSNPRYWDVVDARGIPTRGLTDHHLWMGAVWTPRVAVGGGTLLDPSRKVTHTVELSYPRAGRRRLDLRFVQGENVTEVVQPRTSGAEFANGVVTLGKGEGSKTIRGESIVRDGRLRRVTLYTDKLAGSAARCFALSKRERGYRTLGLRVDSIVVADHPHAPMRSWDLGDDVFVEYEVPHLGREGDWYRVMAWALVTDSTARLYLERADAFTYGPVVPPPSDDAPADDWETDSAD